ncbi:hypothetical protein BGZ95_009242 [Linnemannia exigua]|uniref:Uncharacterized protein n=1 Tax=Linnemannia exigua TaxID=604196 RepID=A0AAD4H5X0_9FUNG|nr:hypothetical protein BGZ95_009242 [Linnemannia exigua]
MSSTIPNYAQACLAADNANSGVYLVGAPASSVGRLEVNYVSVANINTPTASSLGYRVDTVAWASGAPKACFSYPSDTQANSGIKVIQFSENKSYMSTIQPDGTVGNASLFHGVAYTSHRLFTLSGTFRDFDMFNVFTNSTSLVTSTRWMGVRLSFTEGVPSYREEVLGHYPTVSPLVAVGTYSSFTGNYSKGYSVVFDTAGRGQAFPALGSSVATPTTAEKVLTLGIPVDVNMNEIKLTADAIPVTLANTGLIVDKALDGSTVVYSINPDESATLNQITSTGGSPPFSAAMALTALNKHIITYTPSIEGVPVFNSFDTTTGIWSGPGLMNGGGTAPGSSVSLAAIIGGTMGALLLIALVVLLIFRRLRHRQAQQKSTKDASVGHQDNNADQFDSGDDQAKFPLYQIHQQQPGQHQLYNQQQPGQDLFSRPLFLHEQSYYQTPAPFQPQPIQEMYLKSPLIFVPPPPPVNVNALVSYEPYQQHTDHLASHAVEYVNNDNNSSAYKQLVVANDTPATTATVTATVVPPTKPQTLSPQYVPPTELESTGRSPQFFSNSVTL